MSKILFVKKFMKSLLVKVKGIHGSTELYTTRLHLPIHTSRAMEVAALGRPFSLGMMYDCRSDLLIPGMTLWDRDDLMKDIGERPQTYNDFEIVASESIDDKSSVLSVNASLKASFLGGLIEVGGSAKYLNDSKSSRNQARVTLKYKATTNIQELSMNQLGRGNVKHPYVFDQGLATHVVTAILYGAQAFFVFDREVSEKENHQDIQGNLKVMIKKIPKCAIEGKASLKIEEKDRANLYKICKSPADFVETFKLTKTYPKLLETNGEKAVPVKVWLLPLTTLDSSAAKLVHEIIQNVSTFATSGIELVQEAQRVLEDFGELEMRWNDALRTKSFKEICSEFKLKFQQTLAKKLPSIRGGGEEEAELAEVLKKRHSSPFSSKNLNDHLYEEEQVVCFVFTSLGKDEPYLSALSNYLKGKTSPDHQDPHTHDVEKEQWYASKEVTGEMRKKAKLFSDFSEANKKNENIKFLTVGLTNETQEVYFLYDLKHQDNLNHLMTPDIDVNACLF
uniref:Uncharacterized protein n=1 Tax=Amphilophus citrinellus TaxID=61819 RepID=A0A3Q0SY70_AMPCI